MCSRSSGGTMFDEKPVLIVEDNVYLALDLSIEVEELNGRVVGPAGSIDEALALLGRHPIAAAVVSSHVGDSDVSPVVAQLGDRGVPFLIHTGSWLPASLAHLHFEVPVLTRPINPREAIERLLGEFRKARGLAVRGETASD